MHHTGHVPHPGNTNSPARVSSVAQLEENLAAVDLELTPEQRARLDAVH